MYRIAYKMEFYFCTDTPSLIKSHIFCMVFYFFAYFSSSALAIAKKPITKGLVKSKSSARSKSPLPERPQIKAGLLTQFNLLNIHQKSQLVLPASILLSSL